MAGIVKTMLKKSILCFSILLFSACFCLSAQAQESESQEVEPGLTPDHPFYFLDTLGEQLSLFFTFNSEAKAEKALSYAEEKVAELEVVSKVEEVQEKILERANKRYQRYLEVAQGKAEKVKEKGVNVDELSQKMAEAMLNHQERLTKVYERVPEQAKGAIDNALQKSQHGYNTAIQAINSEQVKEQIRVRLEAAKDRVDSGLIQQQEQKINQAKNQIQGIIQGGISEQEWSQVQGDLTELTDTLEEIIKGGVPQESKEKAIEGLDQLEQVTLNCQKIAEQEKQDALDLITQVKNLVETGLTPTQQLNAVSALEEVKKIMQQVNSEQKQEQEQDQTRESTEQNLGQDQGQGEQTIEQVRQRIEQSLSSDQKEALDQAQQKTQEKLQEFQKGLNK